MNKFFNFKVFITPVIIKWLWLIVSLISILAGISLIINGINDIGPGLFDSATWSKPNWRKIMNGFSLLVAAPIILRIIAEMIYNNFTQKRGE